jgi:HK97 family phage major capsid protein
MLSKIRELREKRAKIHAEAHELISKPTLTAEDRAKFDAMMADMDLLKADIDRLERAEAAEKELRETTRPPEAAIGDDPTKKPTQNEEAYRSAFRSFLKNGLYPDQRFPGVSEDERRILMEHRDMGTGGGNALQGSGGGYFVPVGFVNKVEEAMKYYGDMLNVSTILDTATGQPLPYPTDNDTSTTGELVGEASQVTTADVTLSNIVLNAYKFSTKMVKVSIELLQDSAFDIESYLAGKFGTRLGRILNTKFTTGAGSGSGEPKGIITAATSSGVTVIGDDNATSPDPTVQVGYLDLVALEHSVDIAYRRGAKFMMADTTLRYIKGLKDKYGHPLWLPGMAVNSPDTILGYGYSINNDVAALAASAKTVAFGALDKYLIRRVKELAVLRLVERFADYGQVAFLGFARYDGNLLDAGTHPVKYLTQHS